MNIAGVYGYGLEFRRRVVNLVLGGATPEKAACHFSVHFITVKSYLERHRNHTLHVRVKSRGRHRMMTAPQEQQLLRQVDSHPNANLAEHARMLEEATGLHINSKTVGRVFARHHITHKKTRVAQEWSEERRAIFLNDLKPYLLHPERLVFLDESGLQTNMTRGYGYARAPSYLRAVYAVPRNHGQNQSLICALNLAGPLAPPVVDDPVNGEVFEWYVREELCPALSAGQVMILDHLSSCHRASIRTLVEARGSTLLYLLPYSPDFNPIELLLSKLKALVRGDASRTIQNMMSRIGTALQKVLLEAIRQAIQKAAVIYLPTERSLPGNESQS
ncbi:IS630 family transposase, partial [Deinococcus frigens]|uniref:IS630 family transposase n=1 Tax=Deinococcus frigens TaxID=249403 RepID=UPI00138E4A65